MRGHACRQRAFHEDDGGFTTLGMVLALLISLSLMFGAARVYRVESAAADVQNVADAAALAAENQVASFYTAAQVCDAIVLSLALTGVVAAGLGVAALCTPATAVLSDKLIDGARTVFQARDRFARKAAGALDRLQKLLPFLAAAQAGAVVQANSGGGSRASYTGCAVLLPTEGEPVRVGNLDGTQEMMDGIDGQREGISEAAREAEESAKEADGHKMRAYMADCGNAPGYCMFERAESLGGLSGLQNPYFGSVDAWSFSVALERAQRYYPRRLEQEHPRDDSVAEQSNSALRVRFYTYACKRVAQGYVHEDATGSFDADFPLLPRNTDEMRSTDLYTEQVYPITVNSEGKATMHAWSGCPAMHAQQYAGLGSARQWEMEQMEKCPVCEFSAVSVGSVAAASTSIGNGFEYHYDIVAEEARAYQQARERYTPAAEAVKQPVRDLMKRLSDLLSSAVSARISVSPPGRTGAVALVVDIRGVPADSFFPSSFVRSGATLGPRAAISAATLAKDDADDTGTVLSSLFDGFAADADGFGFGGLKVIVHLWSSLLGAYAGGQDTFEQGVREAIDSIPFASASGLGTWAADALADVVKTAGLQPADLSAFKPVTVNSYHVLSHDAGDFSQTLLQIKVAYARIPEASTGSPLTAAVDALEMEALRRTEVLEEQLVIAEIQLLGEDGPSIPLTIALPPAVKDSADAAISDAFQDLRDTVAQATGVKVWE